jgi:signal transduction histidine kinase
VLFGIFDGGVSQRRNGVVKKFGADYGLVVGSGYIRLSDLLVRSVFADRNQQVWVGTDSPLRGGGGLFKLDDGEFTRPLGYENINDHISAIYQDRSGRLWLGTAGGLVLEDGERWKTFTTRDNLSSDAVTSLADDTEGNLWIGTDGGGLNRLRDGQFTAFHKKDGLPSEHISALCADKEGVLWIGTSSGLARLSKGAWTQYTRQTDLSGKSIDYLIEDTNDFLWIGSNAGLMRVPMRALNEFAHGGTDFIPCQTFAKPDGLPSRECTPGSQPSACQTSDGKLWFATIRGLSFVNPAELTLNTNPPPVMIESVLVDGEEQNTNGIRASLPASITIPAGKEHLEIQFTSLNLDAPDKARFRYQMEPHETRWIDAGSSRMVRYSSLSPGYYDFHVTACNEDGVWNQTGASLAFIIEPPIWLRWWFLTASALALLGLIIGIVHYFSTQRLQRQLEGFRQQQALEKERSRIARDIHDQLGASLTQVSLLGEMVESDKNDPREVEAHAKQIYQTARDTSRVLDEIVWTVNPSNDTLDGLINYICKYAQEYLAVAGLRYRLDVPAELPAAVISPEVRHNVFLAAKEAVTNVVRHAKATEVWLRLRLESGSFTLEIQDNGCGPSGLEGKSSRNGLRNMHKRMEDIGGRFALSAAPEGGTLARLTVPISQP